MTNSRDNLLSSEHKNGESTAYRNPRIRVRLYHDFEKPRSGRELFIPSCDNVGGDDEKHVAASITSIQKLIAEQIDLSVYEPHVYNGIAECFIPITSISSETLEAERGPSLHGVPRIDVKLVTRRGAASSLTPGDIASRLICNSSAAGLTSSWFGIGILRGKTAANHGSLWRSALQFGAALTFTIGRRYERRVEGCADVYKTLRQIPYIPYPDVAAFMAMAPFDAKIIVVEYGGTNLINFSHPKRALYVLGSEDAGVPPALVARAHAHVSVPTAVDRPSSLNVAATGAIILYDRLMKEELAKSSKNDDHSIQPETCEDGDVVDSGCESKQSNVY